MIILFYIRYLLLGYLFSRILLFFVFHFFFVYLVNLTLIKGIWFVKKECDVMIVIETDFVWMTADEKLISKYIV